MNKVFITDNQDLSKYGKRHRMKQFNYKKVAAAIGLILLVYSCAAEPTNHKLAQQISPDTLTKKPDISKSIDTQNTITYQLKSTTEWLAVVKADSSLKIAFALNRTDESNFSRIDSVVIPSDLGYELSVYMPFPLEVDYLKTIHKIIYFSYPTQTFAAYQNGLQVYTGPTNMGRENHLSPTGLFFTNWKAKVTTSTINAEWILKWNFNFSNNEGIGWHVYSLPGYPVSHACLRLTENDAQFLYYWADQWVLADPNSISVNGTPVIIFGTYDFGSPKPWLRLVHNPYALDITQEEIKHLTQPHLSRILANQQLRTSFQLARNQNLPQIDQFETSITNPRQP
jgi:lipoprotein-anchoring transpeptidase ErfK/SrfK